MYDSTEQNPLMYQLVASLPCPVFVVHSNILEPIHHVGISYLNRFLPLPAGGPVVHGSRTRHRLGQYEEDQFADDRMRAPLAKFKQALEEIEVDIVDS